MDFNKKAKSVQDKIGVDVAIVIALQNGIQANIVERGFYINFYYGKKGRKFHRTDNDFTTHFEDGKEVFVIKQQIEYNKPTFTKAVALIIKELNDVGTQACIDHIKRKLETFKKVHTAKEDNQTAVMLLNLSVELEQYL